CNNRLSAFTEMRSAALLPKPTYGTAALSAEDVLRLATLGGAEVLGLDDEIGSLERGKRGDVIVVDGRAPHMRPKTDPYTTLVYAAEAADVKHVFVDGEWLVRDQKLVRMDLDEVLDDAERELDGLYPRALGKKRR